MKFFFQALVLCLSILTLQGCGENKPKTKILALGTSADNPPYEFFSVEKNEIVGFDIDLARLIAQELEMSLEVKDMDFNALIPAVSSGRIDMAMAALDATPERLLSVGFSEVYYETKAGLVVKNASLKTIEDFTKGKKIGAQLGASHEMFLKDLLKKGASFTLETRNKVGDLIQELKSGRLDGVFIEGLPAQEFASRDKELTFYPVPSSKVSFSIAFKKESSLINRINKILEELKKRGEIEKLEKKWLQ